MVFLLPLIFLASTAALAKYKTDIEGSAYGTFEKYKGEPEEAEIVSGVWTLKIMDGKVHYYACVLEKNLDESEGGPVNSADILEYTMISKPFYITLGYDENFGRDVLKVMGVYQVKKLAAQFDGSYTTQTWTTWSQLTILDNGTVYTVNNPYDETWWKTGTVEYEDFF